ncbi:hypothetical protein lerEdw1_002637 [Lerista edwardsae]|nr:hypothetical protein lerEdw1_002637 [Lerista edwardsae]
MACIPLLQHLESCLQALGRPFIRLLLSEVFPGKLQLFPDAAVALQQVKWQETYPMDFYAGQSLGPWTANHSSHQPQKRSSAKEVKPILPSVPACESCTVQETELP